MDPPVPLSRRPDFLGNKQARGEIFDAQILLQRSAETPQGRAVSRRVALPYELVPVDTRKGDQFKPEFLRSIRTARCRRSMMTACSCSTAMRFLLYLAEKTGKFLPPNTPKSRAQLLSWLMFVATGLGPYSGQAVHFKHFAPKDLEYAHNRYQFEAQRHYGVLNDHLAKSRYIGRRYLYIVGHGLVGWARLAPFVLGEETFAKFSNVKRLVDEISSRPAAARAIALKDKFVFKGRNGRRSARHHVPSSQDQGGVISSATNRRVGKRRSCAVPTFPFPTHR